MNWIMKRLWGSRSQQEGPPNLDEILKKWMGATRLNKGKKESQSSPGAPLFSNKAIAIGVGAIVALWIASGFYIVHPAEEAVVLRFGKLVGTETQGLHWVPQGIERKYVINVDQVMMLKLEQVMLTQSENMVSVSFAVQYRISDIEAYLFNAMDPVHSLKQIMDSSVRQVVGHSELNDILTKGRTQIAEEVRKQIVELVKRYNTGLEITDVAMQSARAPDPVKESFDDVIKAREDKVRIENEAIAYANHLIPVAYGRANRLLQTAKADAMQMVFEARGQVAQFDQLLPQYQKTPGVLTDRLYFDAMEQVLKESRVVIVDEGQGSNNLLYIPIEQLVGKSSEVRSLPVQSDNDAPKQPTATEARDRDASKTSGVETDESLRDRRRREFIENLGA